MIARSIGKTKTAPDPMTPPRDRPAKAMRLGFRISLSSAEMVAKFSISDGGVGDSIGSFVFPAGRLRFSAPHCMRWRRASTLDRPPRVRGPAVKWVGATTSLASRSSEGVFPAPGKRRSRSITGLPRNAVASSLRNEPIIMMLVAQGSRASAGKKLLSCILQRTIPLLEISFASPAGCGLIGPFAKGSGVKLSKPARVGVG
jgi:hypothetical protein